MTYGGICRATPIMPCQSLILLGIGTLAALSQTVAAQHSIPFEVPRDVRVVNTTTHELEFSIAREDHTVVPRTCIAPGAEFKTHFYTREATNAYDQTELQLVNWSAGGMDRALHFKGNSVNADGLTVSLGIAHEVEVVTAPSSPTGASIYADLVIRNLDLQPHEYHCALATSVTGNDQAVLGVVSQQTCSITVPPEGTVTVPIEAAWNGIRQWISLSEFVTFQAYVTRVGDERRWFESARVCVLGLPVQVAARPSDRIALGRTVTASITCFNPLTTPLTTAILDLGGGEGLPIEGKEQYETIAIGTIPPHASVTIRRSLLASIEGVQVLIIHFHGDGVVQGETSLDVVVCTTDFNHDGIIDSRDYSDFAAAFVTNSASADFNQDGTVNALDYFDFLADFFAPGSGEPK